MKRLITLLLFVTVLLAGIGPALAFDPPKIPPKGIEGPNIRAKVPPKGLEGPDIRAKLDPKGVEGPDTR
ncbi:MAG TPA: hypothetical protein VGC81_11415 [Candidatus Methylomirabilis sp.]|jgi:hypothetical protein